MKTNERILKITLAVVLVWAILLIAAARTKAEGRTYSAEDVDALCKCVWGEYRGPDTGQIAAVVWCVLNRVDSEAFPNDISAVIKQPWQFSGYAAGNPVEPRIERIVYDVLARWQAEEQCVGSIGRVLPAEYLFFCGNGRVNLYTTAYGSREYWDWALPSPYEEEENA